MSSFCLGCGNSMADGERFCSVCGHDTQVEASTPRIDPAVAFGLPPETSRKAIFSLFCGILFIILPFSIIGVIFGYIALSEIRKDPGRLKGRGLAIAGIALSYIGCALIVFVFGLGIYEIRKESKQASQKHTARTFLPRRNAILTAVRTLNTAEIAYSQRHPDTGYTCSLADLSTAWEIDTDLHDEGTNGYNFDLRCSPVHSGGKVMKYRLLAYPSAKSKKPGAPVYCSDESDVIRVSHGDVPEDCLKNGRDLAEKEITPPPNSYSQNAPK